MCLRVALRRVGLVVNRPHCRRRACNRSRDNRCQKFRNDGTFLYSKIPLGDFVSFCLKITPVIARTTAFLSMQSIPRQFLVKTSGNEGRIPVPNPTLSVFVHQLEGLRLHSTYYRCAGLVRSTNLDKEIDFDKRKCSLAPRAAA